MFSPDAIEKLKEADTAAELASTIEAAGLNGDLLAAPSGFTLHDLEKFQEGRRNFRGRFDTMLIGQFLAYCKRAADIPEVPPTCFVDAQAMSATTIFDLGNSTSPGHARHRAVLTLEKTAPYKALRRVVDSGGDQRSIAEWLEDWREYIECRDSEGSLLVMKEVIQAVRSVDVKELRNVGSEVQNLSATKSTLESVHVSSAHQLPSEITFSCIPYEGLNEWHFAMRLSALTGGDAVKFKLHVRQEEQMLQDMATYFAGCIQGGLTGMSVYVGTFES